MFLSVHTFVHAFVQRSGTVLLYWTNTAKSHCQYITLQYISFSVSCEHKRRCGYHVKRAVNCRRPGLIQVPCIMASLKASRYPLKNFAAYLHHIFFGIKLITRGNSRSNCAAAFFDPLQENGFYNLPAASKVRYVLWLKKYIYPECSLTDYDLVRLY